MHKNSKIYIAGHTGLVGSAIHRRLLLSGYNNIIVKSHSALDLTSQAAVEEFFLSQKPEYVFLAAARVGGIMANYNYPAEFLYENIMISANVIHASYKNDVKKLINLGSSCIYPNDISCKITENDLLSSKLEKSNEAYAIAKISALKLCEYYNRQYKTNYLSLMPTNQYGINDNFNLETAHLLPMVMRKFHLAKMYANDNYGEIVKDLKKYKVGWGYDEELDFDDCGTIERVLNKLGIFKDCVILWGDGSVYRELMSADDLADACVYFMNNIKAQEIGSCVNITSGKDIQLNDLFMLVKNIVGFAGDIKYDSKMPNGTTRKLMSDERLKKFGWKPKISLLQGIADVYNWYKEQV